MSLLIRNGRIITAVDDYWADIFIENEKISLIGMNLNMKADQILDATNLFVIPGGIDPHTHLDELGESSNDLVSADDFETGTKAAAHGGTTTIIDFPFQKRGHSTFEALEKWHRKAEDKAVIDYGFHMVITDATEARIEEIRKLIDEGITSFKLFMAYPDDFYLNDSGIFRVMCKAGEVGAIVLVHAENGIVIDTLIKQALESGKKTPIWHALSRPTCMESEAVHRAIAISKVARASVYIVHLSCSESLEQVIVAQKHGVPVYAETCPRYLLLDQKLYELEKSKAARYKFNPPLREKWNQDSLWFGLKNGYIHCIASDHSTYKVKNTQQNWEDFTKIPGGIPSIENRMSLLFSEGVIAGRLNLNKFVELTSTAAAKLFGLFPCKGTIAVGSDADIVLFNPKRKETISIHNPLTHHMNVDYSLYEGFEVQGIAETVVVRGKLVIRNNEFVGRKGNGMFLKRNLPYI